jgi:hypothetical protein
VISPREHRSFPARRFNRTLPPKCARQAGDRSRPGIGNATALIASYKRSLALDDPTNFNAEMLRKTVAEAQKNGP